VVHHIGTYWYTICALFSLAVAHELHSLHAQHLVINNLTRDSYVASEPQRVKWHDGLLVRLTPSDNIKIKRPSVASKIVLERFTPIIGKAEKLQF